MVGSVQRHFRVVKVAWWLLAGVSLVALALLTAGAIVPANGLVVSLAIGGISAWILALSAVFVLVAATPRPDFDAYVNLDS